MLESDSACSHKITVTIDLLTQAIICLRVIELQTVMHDGLRMLP